MSSVTFTYNEDVGKQIDETRFSQQFFVNKRGFYNHSVDPFSRLHIKREPVPYRNVHPPESNYVEVVHLETDCCNRPDKTVMVGRKSEDAPLENSTFFWTELNTAAPHRVCRTTGRIGFDQTEN
jgi:hypothetical protein